MNFESLGAQALSNFLCRRLHWGGVNEEDLRGLGAEDLQDRFGRESPSDEHIVGGAAFDVDRALLRVNETEEALGDLEGGAIIGGQCHGFNLPVVGFAFLTEPEQHPIRVLSQQWTVVLLHDPA
mgnify:CR=1 FL=1